MSEALAQYRELTRAMFAACDAGDEATEEVIQGKLSQAWRALSDADLATVNAVVPTAIPGWRPSVDPAVCAAVLAAWRAWCGA